MIFKDYHLKVIVDCLVFARAVPTYGWLSLFDYLPDILVCKALQLLPKSQLLVSFKIVFLCLIGSSILLLGR